MKNLRILIPAALIVALTGCGQNGGEAGLAPQNAAPARGGDLRVDRMGMPAIATAVITSKDAYNVANPTDDAAGTFVGEITANVDFLHSALDDDLTGLGLTPCATGDCVGQAAPFVVPDVITLDTSQPAGFPNGRRLTDPVIDVTLALVLLDLSVHPVDTLIGVNPTANDLPFGNRFPYLARPHLP
ncbi:MAG: DUF4331 family protein [Gemmatimonadetes bacterium]|nr:DUF4331 family protein [Gemmatimonadota bacterium]